MILAGIRAETDLVVLILTFARLGEAFVATAAFPIGLLLIPATKETVKAASGEQSNS
jgi:hypothetical protein